MLKRIAVIFSAVTLLFSTCAYAKTVEFILGEPTYASVDNYEKETNTLLAAPFIQNDRTMIPVRAVSESFGSLVMWDPNTRSVTISKDGNTIQLVIDSFTATVNGTDTTLDAAPCIVNDTTFVPVRFVTETLGFQVNFIPRTKSVVVCDKNHYITVDNTAVTYPEYEALRYLLAAPELTGQELSAYTRSYLLKNTALLNAANQNSVKLTDEQDNNINLALLQYSEDLPFTKGAFALLMENEEKGLAYIRSVYNQDAVQNEYKTNYVCVKHVLVSGGTDSENETLANSVYEQAKNGADFDKLIADFGGDPGMQANPGGYVFTKGEMVSAFESAAFALKEGEISRPVKSEYGYHIIKRLPLPALNAETENKVVYNLYITPLIENSVIG